MSWNVQSSWNSWKNRSTTPGPPSKNRRSFLGALLATGTVCVGALLSVPLIRFTLFPLLRRTTELKASPVGLLSEFSSLSEPVQKTIQIQQVDGWRKAVSEKAVYVTKDSSGQLIVLSSVCPHLGCTVTTTNANLSVHATGALTLRMEGGSVGRRSEEWIASRQPLKTVNCWCVFSISGNLSQTKK